MKIFIIDDDKETTTMLSKFFKLKDFEVTVTNDPMEGVIKIRREHFDIILLDISMPVVTGFGVIELLAGADILKKQNIFILSKGELEDYDRKKILGNHQEKVVIEKIELLKNKLSDNGFEDEEFVEFLNLVKPE